MIGRDGRVRVMDFGLARAAAGEAEPERPAREEARVDLGVSSSFDVRLTRTGAVMGTPLYMAPEQHDGRPLDARSDVFAFSVALYQGLYGQRPFAGSTPAALMMNSQRGAIQAPPAGSRVPRWLWAIVVRGLRADPEARYPSMEALLADLGRDRGALRRTLATLGVGAVVAGVAASMVVGGQRCDDGGEAWSASWGEARRAAIVAALGEVDAEAAGIVGANVDRYVDAWKAGYVEACEATRERGVHSEALLDLRMACLERQRRTVEALLAAVGPAQVDRAVEASYRLPDVALCADVGALLDEAPLPTAPAERRRIDELRGRSGAAWMLRELGQQRESAALLEAVVAELRATGYAPALAEALANLGDAELELGEIEVGLGHLDEAARLAAASRERLLLARIFGQRAFMVGIVLGRSDAGFAWIEASDLLLQPGDTPRRRVSVLVTRALLHDAQGDRAAARARYEAALALAEAELGPEHPVVGKVVGNLGGVESALGELDAADAHLARAIAITRAKLGPRHTDLGHHLLSQGDVARLRGDLPRALAITAESLALRRERLGDRHSDVARALSNLATIEAEMGRFEDAARDVAEAQAIQLALFGPDHPDSAITNGIAASIQRSLGRLDEAEAGFERSLAAATATLGPESEVAIAAEVGLAEVELARGRAGEARRRFEGLRARVEASQGPHPSRLSVLDGLVRAILVVAPGEAVPAAEALVAATGERWASPLQVATAKVRLAEALVAAGSPVAQGRARALVEEAAASGLGEAEAAGLRASIEGVRRATAGR